MSTKYIVSVDVGTSSVRAALITLNGRITKKTIRDIQTWNPEPEHYEQSSDEIWDAICFCIKDIIVNVSKSDIIAVSFDATCSLVCLRENGQPLSISRKYIEDKRNIILWMDHRAEKETIQINSTGHDLLRYVGGQVSVEMQMPKLKWLKDNYYERIWKNIWKIFDLADYLTWRATGYETRSLCTLVCKWNYDAINMKWDKDFLQQINLIDLLRNNGELLGNDIKEPGQAIGKGLSKSAANDFNLLEGTVVSTSLIDAHAGSLGLFGCHPDSNLEGKLAMICGTSTCHMSLMPQPIMIDGVWGPYRNAIITDYYLTEAGQSATGLLLDYIIKNHPSTPIIQKKLEISNQNIYTYLNDLLEQMANESRLDNLCYLTKDLHIWPDFHGNRSPLSDPQLKGMISGLNLNVDEKSLAILYLAFIQSLAYGTRHIIERLEQKREKFHTLLFCGGLSKNPLYIQTHADVCQLNCIVPYEEDTVLIGTAMLGATASKIYENLRISSEKMGSKGLLIEPMTTTTTTTRILESKLKIRNYHNCKYKVFMKMLSDQRTYKQLMNDF